MCSHSLITTVPEKTSDLSIFQYLKKYKVNFQIMVYLLLNVSTRKENFTSLTDFERTILITYNEGTEVKQNFPMPGKQNKKIILIAIHITTIGTKL